MKGKRNEGRKKRTDTPPLADELREIDFLLLSSTSLSTYLLSPSFISISSFPPEGGREYFPASSSSGISSPVTSPSAVFGRVAGAMLPYLYRVPRCQVPAGILVDEQRSLIGWWHCERVRDPHSEVGWSAWRYYGQITSSIALTAANTPNH